MASRTAFSLLSMLGLAFISVISAAPLPEGNSGIAARYPFDAGIASDPAVIFADDFESYSGAGWPDQQMESGVPHRQHPHRNRVGQLLYRREGARIHRTSDEQ